MNIKQKQQTYTYNPLKFVVETSILCFLMLTSSVVKADDTEVFYTESEINNNVLFIMDNSGSMSEKVAGTTTSDSDTTTITSTISHNDDDAEEWVSGSNNDRKTFPWSSDLGLSYDRKNDGQQHVAKVEQIIGLRFEDIAVPAGATISSAYIQFTADEDPVDVSDDVTTLNIKIQSHDDGARFTSGVKNIANRSLYSEVVTWNPPAWNTPYEKGDAQKTPNLKDLVQLVVDRDGWEEDNALVFVIGGTGTRSARSRNQGANDAPVLTIEYYEAGEKTRMQVMQDALRTVLTNAPDNLSVGIMNYGDTVLWRNPNDTNGVKFPVTAVNDLAKPIVEDSITVDGTPRWGKSNIPVPSDTVTVRDYISQIADDWKPNGYTPIVDALYEASQYFRAGDVDWGFEKAETRRKWGAHPSTYEGDPVEDAYLKNECGATSNKRIYNGNIANWDSGNTGGIYCPADVTSPSVATSSEANCAATKHNCSSYSYKPCTKRKPRTTTCTGTDENGNATGCTTTGGQCIEYGSTVSGNRCDYDICRATWERQTPPKYVTPMQDGCQSNFMILMSDGKPEYSNGVNTNPRSYDKVKNLLNVGSCDVPFGFQSGRCGADLTHHLATHDNSTDVNGDQFLHTYVIGFSEGITEEAGNYLKSLVTLEDDPDTAVKEGYFSATNEAELADAFAQALDEIAEEARSQASPGYSVNVKSGLEHEDDIYIPVFDKKSSSVWSGNLKKFKLVDVNGSRIIQGKADAAGNSYIDAMTELGLFKDDAWDEFSNSAIPDGNAVEKGGTAGLLDDSDPSNPRKLYSNLTGDTNVALSGAANHIQVNNNTGLTSQMLFDANDLNLNDSEAAEYRTKLINFIRGWQGGIKNNSEPYGQQRYHMGDMLHSEPVIITYEPADENGNGKEQYIFAATNEGYLHVFDSSTGEEQFAFMPKELLKNIEPQYTGQGPHLYGIDGSISYWHDDKNKNNTVDGTDKVYVFFGMRRGGRSYYALDVTNIEQPILKWVADNNDTGLGRLGQSWSMPYLARIKHNGVKKEVVVVTAGNDPYLDYGEDSYQPSDVLTDREATTMGDDIFILDAEDGSMLWSMRRDVDDSKIKHGIPGGVRILDVNRNGLLDRMYFGDTGGNVWRLDMSESLSTDADDYDLSKLASLGGSGVNSRKFYNEPDVAQLRANGKTKFTVSIGSGIRPHPINEEINDHMFVLIDDSPLDRLPDDYDDDNDSIQFNLVDLEKVEITAVDNNGVITKSINKSSDFEGKNITDVIDSDDNKRRGWYVDFSEAGEKVLAQSITFEGSLLFTTLVPEVLVRGELINACAAPATQGRIYAMNILTGEASVDTSKDGTTNDNDVFETISASEIPGTPQRVFNKLECDETTDECTHEVDIRIGKKSSEVSADDVAGIESIYWSDPSN